MSSTDPQDVLEIGQLFAGRYAIEGTLGKGGFSRVYAARQLNLDREVALKVFAPRDLQNKEARQRLAKRFMKEAQLLARLTDPHTITLHDYGVTADGELFQVFELIPGTTFKHLVRQSGPLPASRLIPIITQILWSLSEAHAIGLIHRDIKPSNIMVYDHLERRDRVKVLDFGVAKLVQDYDTAHSDMTADGMILGTPRYMSPEQIIGEPLTPASDLYSLGIVIYEALFMDLPYDRDLNLLRRRQQQISTPVILPDWFEDATLRRFLTRILQGDVERRYADAAEALADLTRTPSLVDDNVTLPFFRHDATTAPRIEDRDDTAELPGNPDTLTSHRTAAKRNSRKRALLLVLLVLLVLGGVGAVVAVTKSRQDFSSDPAPPIQMATSPASDSQAPLETSTPPRLEQPEAPRARADVDDPPPRAEQKPERPAARKETPEQAPTPSTTTSSTTPKPTKKESSKSIDLLPTTPKTPKKRKDDVDLLPTTPKKKDASGFVIKPLE